MLKAPNSGEDSMMPPMPMGDPMGGGGEPPMPGADPMGGGEPPMGGEEPEMGGENGDAEGGPGSDVKKYSGELSQALNTYNEENPNDDDKINKYAINMIAAQVADNLSDKDKRNVIKKLKGDSDDMSSDEQPDEMGGEDPQMAMENRIIKEITDELVNGRKSPVRKEKYVTNKRVTKSNPFVSNR